MVERADDPGPRAGPPQRPERKRARCNSRELQADSAPAAYHRWALRRRMTQSGYLFLGLTAIVAVLAAVLAFAVLKFLAAARAAASLGSAP